MLDHHSHGGMKHFGATSKNDRLFAAGTAYLRELVEQHQIQCDWSDWGRIYVAAETSAEGALKGVAEGFDKLGVQCAPAGRRICARLWIASRRHRRSSGWPS